MSSPRDKAVVEATKARDKYRCRRCYRGRSHDLEAHHVKALSDGGADTIDNTITLCGTCHREWHDYLEHRVDHDTFMGMPPYVALIAIMTRRSEDNHVRGLIYDEWGRYKRMCEDNYAFTA